MTRLVWIPDSRIPTGLDRGVLYSSDGRGHTWTGLVSVIEAASRVEISSYFLEGIEYNRSNPTGIFRGGITAFTYPDVLNNLERETYGVCYRTWNDVEHSSYSIHLIYNVTFTPSDKSYSTQESSIEIPTFDWKIDTQPANLTGYFPTAHFVFDTSQAHSWMIAELEKVLYGTDDTDARLPPIDELVELFEHYSILKITDLGDGRFTAEGPDNVVIPDQYGGFTIDWMSVENSNDPIYTAYSA